MNKLWIIIVASIGTTTGGFITNALIGDMMNATDAVAWSVVGGLVVGIVTVLLSVKIGKRLS